MLVPTKERNGATHFIVRLQQQGECLLAQQRNSVGRDRLLLLEPDQSHQALRKLCSLVELGLLHARAIGDVRPTLAQDLNQAHHVEISTLAGRRIKEDADYQGVRLTFMAFLEKARVPIQIDIGFGDVVNPGAEERDYPALLDFPAPNLRMYPRETVIAEKFEAMVQLGTLNTRMKDFFDIWLLASQYDFAGSALALAVAKTFDHRGTKLEANPIALTRAFTSAERTQKQWATFVKRSQLATHPQRSTKPAKYCSASLLPWHRPRSRLGLSRPRGFRRVRGDLSFPADFSAAKQILAGFTMEAELCVTAGGTFLVTPRCSAWF